MKTIFKSVLLMSLIASAHAQQDKPQAAFVRIVNAVSPGMGNAKFLIDGKDLYPEGYSIGQTTGGYGIAAGNHAFEVRKEGVEKGVTRLKFAAGETITLIAFGEKIPPLKPEDPVKWRVKLLILKQKDEDKSYNLSLVSVIQMEEIPLQVTTQARKNAQDTIVKRLSVTSVNMGKSRSEMQVKYKDKTLTMISPDSRGNYVVVVYENAEGQIEALNFFDPKFVVAG